MKIDGRTFYYVSLADQRHADWNLQQRFVKRKKRGRPTDYERLFGTPAG